MASSGSFTTSGYEGRALTFSWSIKSQSVDSNQTTISWNLKGSGGASNMWYMAGNFKVVINGTTVYETGQNDRIQLFSTTTVASSTANIIHDSSGNATLSVSVEGAIYTYARNVSGSGSWSIDSIPRATQPSLSPSSSVKTGDTITVNLPRASSNFTHTVTWSIGSSTGTISSNAGTSVSWTVPRAIANQMPDTLTIRGTITAITKSGSTTIGSKSCDITVTVSDQDYPSVSAVNVTEATDGLASKFGAFIQNKSKLNVSISAAGIYGSTIKSYEATVVGAVYNKSEFTTDIINQAGNISVTVKVTDSRGRSTTTTKTIQVLEYTAPQIVSFNAERSNEVGEIDDEGEYLLANFNFAIKDLNSKNDKSYKLEYTAQDAESWQTIASGSVYSFEGTAKSAAAILDIDKSYIARLSVTDYFGTTTAQIAISTAFTLVDYSIGGRGIAFGKVSEFEDTADFNIDVILQKSMEVKGATVLQSFSAAGGAFSDIVTFAKYPTMTPGYTNTGSIDDIKTSTLTYCGGGVSGRPVEVNGLLEVINYGSGTVIYQRYTTYTGLKYERILTNNGTWGQWCGWFYDLNEDGNNVWSQVYIGLDGRYEAFGSYDGVSANFTQSLNGVYQYQYGPIRIPLLKFVTLTGEPKAWLEVTAPNLFIYARYVSFTNDSTGQSVNFHLAKATSDSNWSTITSDVHVVGRWK